MLVLSRKAGQQIVVNEEVTITITRISGTRVSVGIEAPAGVKVRRGELKLLTDGVLDEPSSPEIEKPIVLNTGLETPTTLLEPGSRTTG